MTFIPASEKIIETRKCRLSGKEFFVTDKDREFYDKIAPVFAGKKYEIPSPTLCPEERMRRRLCFLNSRHLYNAKSTKSGKPMLSIFSEDKGFQVYHFDEWYATDWDACDFGRKVNFEKTAHENFSALLRVFPKRNIVLGNGSENCEYVCGVGGSKNCYLISETGGATDCYFGNKVDDCEKCVDCSFCMNCHTSYECIQCDTCYGCLYCRDCSNCRDSVGLRDCKNCTDCLFSTNLVNKRFVFFNQQLTESEYRTKLAELREALLSGKIQLSQLLSKIPQDIVPNLHGESNESSLGDYLSHCSECFICFSCNESANCRYCSSLIHDAKDCMDTDGVGNHIENIYESLTINKNCSQILFSVDCWGGCHDVYYSSVVKNSKNIFLSTGMINRENCLLNTPYSVHEYEELCGKMIEHMQSTGEWGEFFSHELSPFGYNETMAQEYFPMTEEEVKSMPTFKEWGFKETSEKGWLASRSLGEGWNWYDGQNKNTYIGQHYEPLPIREYDEKIVGYETAQKNIDAIMKGILECETTKKPFKIIKQELAFYIENGIPIPRKHSDVRHGERMQLRNPRKLHEQKCNNCHENMITSSNPRKQEKVVCEECYRKIVY